MELRVDQRTAELARTVTSLQVEYAERMKAVEESREKDRLLIQQNRLAAMGRNFFRPDKEKSTFSVSQAIQLTLSLVGDSFKNNNIEIVTDSQGDPSITGYYNEFCHALLNIIQNAREALVERKIDGGKVIITTAGESGSVVITITDNAGGIPEEVMGRIFEPYFSTKAVQGTGLGLFMAKTIIEGNMAGSITAQNTGQGAQFRIEV